LPLRQQEGKALRGTVAHKAHGTWKPAPDPPDQVQVVMLKSNEGRQAEFVPTLRAACQVATAKRTQVDF
jgi:hypothetical protein